MLNNLPKSTVTKWMSQNLNTDLSDFQGHAPSTIPPVLDS